MPILPNVPPRRPYASRSSADAALHVAAGAEEPAGFTDVATLWRFVDVVSGSW